MMMLAVAERTKNLSVRVRFLESSPSLQANRFPSPRATSRPHTTVANTTGGFAANQYDCVGNAAGNTTIDSQASGAVVDLFGWSTSATNFGISTSTSDSDYDGGFVDWGKNIGDGSTWFTLSNKGWEFLLETRINARWLYRNGVTVCGKKSCLIIAPDGYTGTIASSYDASTWPAAEAAGLVCLPAAGYRIGSEYKFNEASNSMGNYWTRSRYHDESLFQYEDCSFNFHFGIGPIVTNGKRERSYGNSVRLVRDVK
ncbi:MAG: hypothetical protein MJ215_07655 [Spirochaetia bacterium]|nr:hypothetical protein [Spirochaetia bacterium]